MPRNYEKNFKAMIVNLIVNEKHSIETIKKKNPSPKLIFHSDKNSQMHSKNYRTFPENHNFVFSYTELDHSCD